MPEVTVSTHLGGNSTSTSSPLTYIEVDNNPRCLKCGEKLETMISMDRVNAGVGGPRPFAFCPVCNPQRSEDVHK